MPKPVKPDKSSSCAEEDINGGFPQAVHIKTKTQTFNAYHYYILKDGLIWYKGINGKSGPGEWALFMETGLPHNKKNRTFHNPAYIVEIAADADELVALSEEGRFYRICFEWIALRPTKAWIEKQGWPILTVLTHDSRTVKNIAWSLGKRNDQVKYYEDPFGNQHHNGTMDIATIYVLMEDGQEICYADNGLPADFSRNYIGPERGRFKSVAISASASTMFLINEAGEMYTRMADFDIVGCDPMLFKYTYVPYKSPLSGTDYPSNLTPWALPPEDWRVQPSIPLEGAAAVTRYITILQNGRGNAARELRVAGINEAGETGYWSKAIYDTAWRFVPVPLFFPEDAFLDASRFPGPRGGSLDASFNGYGWEGITRTPDWSYEIPDFNILEGSCSLRITRGDETCTVTLHPVELWTYLQRNYLPGRQGPPKLFLLTLDIPPGAMDHLSEEFSRELQGRFVKYDKKLFHYIMEASNDYVLIQDDSEQVIFLTNRDLSNYLPEFRRSWRYDNYEEVIRYNSPELKVQGGPVFSRDRYAELWRKIEPNKRLLEELEQRVAEFESLKKVVAGSNIAYSTIDFITTVTFLNTIDVPKIHTATRFAKKILSANKTFIDMISDSRIWRDKKLIELLRLRIESYTRAAKELAKGADEASFPKGFAETIQEYWEIAGFPQEMSGDFQAGSYRLRATAVSSQLTQDVSAWIVYLGDRERPGAALLIEPENMAKAIFSRRGKPADQKPYRITGNLYVLRAGGEEESQEFFAQTLASLFNKDPSTGVEIYFDGTELEIRKKRAFQRDIIVFRGKT
jgi:hypothetical protein